MTNMESKTNGKQHEAADIFKLANPPVTLKFEEVEYKVVLGKQGLCQKGEEKLILKGITGLVLPCEMLGVLGPSGGGKTTLLTALGGRLGGKLQGTITYNDKPFSSSIKRKIGFVTQDNVLHPHLTVTETLVFTALLRLPNSLSKEEKIMHAKAVIIQLDLTRCQNNIVGGPFLRGVSGGERKRVSIGQELLINPSLLFLDEPTSGLDSTTAQRIVYTLCEQAKRGRSIVTTMHQPSSRLFYMFDKVLLLSEGNPLYFGRGSEVMDYFSSIGFAPSVAMNPADFLLDLANGVLSLNDSDENQAILKQTLVSTYKSNLASQLKAEDQAITNNQMENKSNDRQLVRWETTWWQQFIILTRRGLKERKHESFSSLKIFQVLAIAFLSGALWWKSDISHLQDQVGLLFAYSNFWGFLPLLQAIFTFTEERLMLEKERSSGMYRISSYFISRTFSDLPMELALPTVFVIITYWMAGLKRNAINFFYTLSVVLVNVLACQGLGLAISASVTDQKTASTLASVLMISFQLAGGFFVQRVPSFIGWIKYMSVSQNTYKLLLGSQYKPADTYPCITADGGRCLVGDYPAIKMVGLDGQVLAAILLAIMNVGFRLVAYHALTRIGVVKR